MPRKTKARKPARISISVFAQLCNLIPPHKVSKTAREYGVERKVRTFSAWSHVVALLWAQFAHALSLNDVCDALKNHEAKLGRIRHAAPPSRNAFSHANRERDSAMSEALFWETLDHLTGTCPKFVGPGFQHPRLFLYSFIDSDNLPGAVSFLVWRTLHLAKSVLLLHYESQYLVFHRFHPLS